MQKNILLSLFMSIDFSLSAMQNHFSRHDSDSFLFSLIKKGVIGTPRGSKGSLEIEARESALAQPRPIKVRLSNGSHKGQTAEIYHSAWALYGFDTLSMTNFQADLLATNNVQLLDFLLNYMDNASALYCGVICSYVYFLPETWIAERDRLKLWSLRFREHSKLAAETVQDFKKLKRLLADIKNRPGYNKTEKNDCVKLLFLESVRLGLLDAMRIIIRFIIEQNNTGILHEALKIVNTIVESPHHERYDTIKVLLEHIIGNNTTVTKRCILI